MARNQSLANAATKGPGKSVSVHQLDDRADATLRCGVQISLSDVDHARVAVEGSISGALGSWWTIGVLEADADTDRAVFTTDMPAAYLRATLLDDLPDPHPVAPPAPVESTEVEETEGGGSRIVTVIEQAPPKPRAPWGCSAWISAA